MFLQFPLTSRFRLRLPPWTNHHSMAQHFFSFVKRRRLKTASRLNLMSSVLIAALPATSKWPAVLPLAYCLFLCSNLDQSTSTETFKLPLVLESTLQSRLKRKPPGTSLRLAFLGSPFPT